MSEVVTLMVGDNAPDFEAPLTDGSKFVLSQVLDSGKGVILYSVSYTHLTLPTKA